MVGLVVRGNRAGLCAAGGESSHYGGQPWLVGLRLVIAAGFAVLAAFEFGQKTGSTKAIPALPNAQQYVTDAPV